MKLTVKVTGNLGKRLGEIKRDLRGKSKRMRAAFKAAGVMVCRDLQKDFLKNARGRGKWKRLGPVSALQRRPGPGFQKIATWKDVLKRAKSLEILRDTGRAFNSFTPGRVGNVLKVGTLRVEAGSNVKYLAEHQEDHPATFDFDEKRFDKIVMRRLPGRKSSKTPGGRKSRAKYNWNPEYFRMRNWLRKIDGETFTVKARPILRKPSMWRKRQWLTPIRQAVEEAVA